MEKRSNSRNDDDRTRDGPADETQGTCSSACQEPTTSYRNRIDADQSKTLSETSSHDKVPSITTGLPTISDHIPDPYILSQTSTRQPKLPSKIPSTSNGSIQNRLLLTSIQPLANLATFSLFSKFPFKIRRMIWKKTLPSPRIILIRSILSKWPLRNTIRPLRNYNTYKSNYAMPNAMLACKEALDVILEESQLVRKEFICKDIPGPCLQSKIVLNFETDSIYLETDDELANSAIHYARRWRPIAIFLDIWFDFRFWTKISHLILSIPEAYKDRYNSDDFRKYLRNIFAFIEGLIRVTFVLADKTEHLPYAQRDLALEYPMDIDYALNLYAKHPREVSREESSRLGDWHKEYSASFVDFDMDALREHPYRNDWTSARRPVIIPGDAVVDFKIIVEREKSEELARRKERYNAVKRQIAEEEDISWHDVCYEGPARENQMML
ncbi:uncharacterized protein EAE97_000939 [Botrytis byssoidea]|uniref:2EXR domain-containing protein n=1 Tax=Botrytis byssoidea TaxID=139641 RepID=A0A9P5IVX4_9HELO|nr:uncharacterized protein EAE97_000939 [Botrytis byssoidea]KAF7953540.1 hypothetical protein EAE97_000939 [Botrytis byssoidea]